MIHGELSPRDYRKDFVYLAAFYSITLFLPNLVRALFYGHRTYDLGIYAEALSKLSLSNLNPFIYSRLVHIFNDHFDPILLLVAPLAKIIRPDLAGIIAESVFILTAAFLLLKFLNHKKFDYSILIFSGFYILFNNGTAFAVIYPIHPTTWAVLPVIIMGIGYMQNKFNIFILGLIFLYTCKEEFPFAGIMASLCFYWRKEWGKGTAVGLLSLIWILFVFKLRPLLFEGEIVDYSSHVLKPMINDPLTTIWKSLSHLYSIQNLFIGLPLVYLLIRNKQIKLDLFFLMMAIPLWLTKLFSMKWLFQYMSVISAFFLIFVLCNVRNLVLKKKEIWALFVFLLAINGITIAKYWEYNPISYKWELFNFKEHLERKNQIDRAIQLLKESEPGVILAQDNFVPSLGEFGRVYMLYKRTFKWKKEFNYFLVEQSPFGGYTKGGSFGLLYESIKHIIDNMRSKKDIEVLIDNKYVFLAKGKIEMEALLMRRH